MRARTALLYFLAAAIAVTGAVGVRQYIHRRREAPRSLEHHPTDLRSAVMTLYPESRGTTLTSGRATLTRTLKWEDQTTERLGEFLRPLAFARGFEAVDAGVVASGDAGGIDGLIAVRGPIELRAQKRGGQLDLELLLSLGEVELGRLLQAPAPLSTETLGALFPRIPDGLVLGEVFSVSLDYRAESEARADFLTHQLAKLLGDAHWSASEALPRDPRLRLVRRDPTAEIRVGRQQSSVHLELEWATLK